MLRCSPDNHWIAVAERVGLTAPPYVFNRFPPMCQMTVSGSASPVSTLIPLEPHAKVISLTERIKRNRERKTMQRKIAFVYKMQGSHSYIAVKMNKGGMPQAGQEGVNYFQNRAKVGRGSQGSPSPNCLMPIAASRFVPPSVVYAVRALCFDKHSGLFGVSQNLQTPQSTESGPAILVDQTLSAYSQTRYATRIPRRRTYVPPSRSRLRPRYPCPLASRHKAVVFGQFHQAFHICEVFATKSSASFP